MTRYKEVYNQMISDNKGVFGQFSKIHDMYALNPDSNQDALNESGKKIMEIVRHYEDILCGHSERSGYGSYSGKLAEKFQDEVKKHFPKIDCVGLKIISKGRDPFSIKKIKLA